MIPVRRASPFQWWLSLLTASMVAGSIAALALVDIPASSQGVLIGLTGTLVGGWMAIINFEFGSSRASQGKDDTITTALATSQASQAPATAAAAAAIAAPAAAAAAAANPQPQGPTP